MRNIAQSPQVAVAVFSTAQPPGTDVRGIQFSGTAAVVPDEEVPQACEQYFSRPGAAVAMGIDRPDPADHQGDDPAAWKFVRVRPTGLWYFDTRHFGDQRAEVPKTVWAP